LRKLLADGVSFFEEFFFSPNPSALSFPVFGLELTGMRAVHLKEKPMVRKVPRSRKDPRNCALLTADPQLWKRAFSLYARFNF